MVQRLSRMEDLQRQVQQAQLELRQLQEAMQVLTPEERLVVQMLIISPEPLATEKLCQILEVERSSVYRRRERAIRKLGRGLGMQNA